MGIEHPVRLTRQRTTDHVHDRHHARALRFRLPRRRQRVGCFARLGNRNEQVVLPDQRVAIAELAPDIDLHRRPHHFLKEILADQPGMPGSPASHDPDPFHRCEFLRRESDVRQIGFSGFVGVPPAHGIENGLGLLVNLLQHEMRIPALLHS